MASHTFKVADAIAIRVGVRSRIYLVDDCLLPPCTLLRRKQQTMAIHGSSPVVANYQNSENCQ